VIDGIFRYGNYGWLGEYRAKSILAIVEKAGFNVSNVEQVLPLDIFHACYLLNTSLIDNPRADLVEIVNPIINDEELRKLTVADDMISRVFAAKFLIELLKRLEQLQGSNGQNGMDLQSLCNALHNRGAKDNTDNKWVNGVREAIVKAKEEAKRHAKNAKLYSGLKAGIGHNVTFGELLDLNFAVDLESLVKMFREVNIAWAQAMKTSVAGSYEGIKFGRDLARVAPSALALPDELFWYRFATSTLPIIETKEAELERFILVVDKSGSMDNRNKTLWSRAVALALARQAKLGSVKAKLLFFDYGVYPSEPIDLLERFDEALKVILTLKCSGGTSIDTALMEADKLDGYTIVLITDGEDKVTYKPRNKLISVMIDGDNKALKDMSTAYLKAEPTREGALKLFEAMKS